MCPCSKPFSAPNSDISVLFGLTMDQAHELAFSNTMFKDFRKIGRSTVHRSLQARCQDKETPATCPSGLPLNLRSETARRLWGRESPDPGQEWAKCCSVLERNLFQGKMPGVRGRSTCLCFILLMSEMNISQYTETVKRTHTH